MSSILFRHWLVAFACIVIMPLNCLAETITGRVVGVSDGDTVTLIDAENVQYKIRFSGIDAPEKSQPFGQKSKEQLSARVYMKEVSAECRKLDKYRRRICAVYVDGKDVNLSQIEAGLAWWYREYAIEQSANQRKIYEDAEINARAEGLGLWKDKNPIPPWEWRHKPKPN